MTYITWLGGSVAVGVFLAGSRAQASPTDSLPVAFDVSADRLPQERIRARLRIELDALTQFTNPDTLGTLSVGLTADGQIRLEYRGSRGPVERQLVRPDDDERLAELVALAAINLASDDSSKLLADLKAKAPLESPPTKPALLTSPPPPVTTNTQPPSARWQLALHAGWWDAGVDVASPLGLFVGVGVPWVAPIIFDYSGRQGLWTLDAKLGYGHPISSRLTMYGELLTAWTYDWGDPCGNGCISRTHRLFFLPALGFRHRWTSGFMLGTDITLAVVAFYHDRDSLGNSSWLRKNISPLAGIAFSQVYVGYDWEL